MFCIFVSNVEFLFDVFLFSKLECIINFSVGLVKFCEYFSINFENDLIKCCLYFDSFNFDFYFIDFILLCVWSV